jgi:hypothetical protein
MSSEPLSLILSPLDKIVNKQLTGAEEAIASYSAKCKRLLNLINQPFDFRKNGSTEFSVSVLKRRYRQISKDITSSFSDISEKKGIELIFHSDIKACKRF